MEYKFLEHTADVKFQAFGKTLEEVFINSAKAMFNTMYSESEDIKEKIKKKIKVEGKDKESLLYNFLEELLFLLDSENFFFARAEKIKIKQNKTKYELEAEVSGDNASNYKISLDVKAVTYNEMFVRQQGDKFICQVVLDV